MTHRISQLHIKLSEWREYHSEAWRRCTSLVQTHTNYFLQNVFKISPTFIVTFVFPGLMRTAHTHETYLRDHRQAGNDTCTSRRYTIKPHRPKGDQTVNITTLITHDFINNNTSIITTNVWRMMTVISNLNIRLMIVQTQQRCRCGRGHCTMWEYRLILYMRFSHVWPGYSARASHLTHS